MVWLRLLLRLPFALAPALVVGLAMGCALTSVPQSALQDQGDVGRTLTPGTSPSESAPVAAPPSAVSPTPPGAASPFHTGEATHNDAAPRAGPPAAGMSDFPIILNAQVQSALRHLQTHKSAAITKAFVRARRYSGMMRTVFRDAGLPEDLVSLAFVESGVNPRATSHANAAGIWQFVPSTARFYGMRTTPSLDERRDPEKSTRAAATYLKYLYERFKSWPLALAAYNVGDTAVQRAIQRQHTRDFWCLRLPKETRRFVPSFMAMTIISREPARYGFSPPPDQPYDTEPLHIAEPTEIRRIAEAAGTSVTQLRELNPELIGPGTPPDPSGYALRIPRRVHWVSHTVRPGETLAAIAKRYGVSEHVLRDMNHLAAPAALKPGKVLLVPTVASRHPA
jgi:membrane-bound lytic murein transglycosylase D